MFWELELDQSHKTMNSSQASYPVLFKIKPTFFCLTWKQLREKKSPFMCRKCQNCEAAAWSLHAWAPGRMEAAAGHRHANGSKSVPPSVRPFMFLRAREIYHRGLWDDGGVWEQRPPGRWATSFGFSTAICLIASRRRQRRLWSATQSSDRCCWAGTCREEVSSPQCRF